MLEVIVASIGYAGGVVIDKIVLSKWKVPVMRFIPLLFIWLCILTSIFLPIYGRVEWQTLLSWRYILLFVLMIMVAVVWNIFYYKGIQRENLHEFELIMLLSPLMTIIFAEIFLPSERSLPVFVAGVIASGALIATRFRRHHMKIGKTAWLTILSMVLLSFESILIKELLSVFSPVALYAVRTFIIALIFLILYRPKLFQVSREAFAFTIISAIFGVMQMVLKFYGFANLGVVETTVILILGPFLVYAFSYFYFKEPLYKRDLLAGAVVVACVLWITLR